MRKQNVLLLASSALSFAVVGCKTTTPPNVENIDTSKTQIYVRNYDGGYGSEWLSKIKDRFEAAHKDDVLEEGKKGVQVYINNNKDTADASSTKILANRDEVIFTEQSSYFGLKSAGILADITDVVTEKLDGEDKSILDKMDDAQKSFYGIEENGEKHYYALPHYSGYFGLTYNVDLFDKKGFYFAKNPLSTRLADKFINKTNIKKSDGPDGVSGTSDDGLPTTYDEFMELCQYIVNSDCVPFLTNGKNSKDYLNLLVNSLATNYEGKEEMSKVFTCEGTVNTLATIKDGAIALDENPTTLTTENGYETSRMAGKYYGIKFLSDIISNDRYYNKTKMTTAYSHTDAQRDFLYGGNDESTPQYAMLSDGCWWENEAKGIFEEMAGAKGESYSRMNRRFAFMPLPQPTKEKADSTKKTTLYDHLFSFCFMKANVADYKKDIVKEFIKFCNTDTSLVEYTVTTNTPKALSYSMSEDDLSQMTYYGRSLYERKANSDIVYPCVNTTFFANNQKKFHTNYQYQTSVNGKTNQYVITGLTDEGYSAETYFSGMYTYYKNEWKHYN